MMVFAALWMLGLNAAPATALSCAPPEPIDWSNRLPTADAAVIGVIESVGEVVGDSDVSSLLVRVRVTEYLHGRSSATLEYGAANFEPWGPYYEVGQEIAIVIEDGVVTDGQMNLCGPWFSPEELRQAAADLSPTIITGPTPIEQLLGFLERLLSLLFGWYR